MRALQVIALASFMLSCDATETKDSCITKSPGLKTISYDGSTLQANTVALTIEGGSLENSQAIADILSANNVNATFFLRGIDFAGNTDSADSIFAQGHTIGNAAFSGINLDKVEAPVLEVRQTDYLIRSYIRSNEFYFLAPEGAFTERLASYLNKAGLNKYTGPITYDHSTYDLNCWEEGDSPNACADKIFAEIEQSGQGIVRISSGDSRSVELSQELLSLFTNGGYSFVELNTATSISAALAANGASSGENTAVCNDYE